MTSNYDAFDDPTSSMAYLYASSNLAALRAARRNGSEEDAPFPAVDPDMNHAMVELRRQVQLLTSQLADEREINRQLLALNAYGGDTDSPPNPERAANGMAKLLARLVPCGLVCIFEYQPVEQRFRLLASAGQGSALVPSSYLPDTSQRLISLAVHNQRFISSEDIPDGGSALQVGGQRFPSLIAAPLSHSGRLHGLILLADASEHSLSSADFPVVATAAAHLLNAWGYARQNEALTEFVQAISMMSVVQETGKLLEMTASIARQALDASYVLVASTNLQEWTLRSAGRAPLLTKSFSNGGFGFLENAIRSPYTFRLRDLRQEEQARGLHIDSADLCTLLACPIRINGTAAGILLAFGKNHADHFTETDVFLAELLASQAAVNLESCYLNHELRANLKTTQLIYDLSLSISKAETLQDASRAIARSAYRLLQARRCGMLLFSSDGRTEAEVHFPTDDSSLVHPIELIQKAMDSRQTIYLADRDDMTVIAIPIQTMRRCYGALWLEICEDHDESHHPTEEIRILVNQAAVALERSILLEETRHQANEITRAYHRLEGAYEDLLYGLTRALDARDGETEKHSWRVEDLSVRLGTELGLTRSELQALKRGALLHDIGKIGVRDAILLKRGPLDESEWQEMRQHPQKGAQIVKEIPALHDALPIIAFHQERWDGSGYPLHLHGTEIPLLARIFAVVDVFDALTSERPYRGAQSMEDALAYIEAMSGIHFDPEIAARFIQMIRSDPPAQHSSLPK